MIFAAAELVHAPLPVAEFVFAVSVVERKHGRGVRRFDETFARLAAHALRGRVGGDQFRMLGFELLQLVHQLVEFGVGDLGIVEHVVAVFVVADFLAQGFDFLFGVAAPGMTNKIIKRDRVGTAEAAVPTVCRVAYARSSIFKAFRPSTTPRTAF